ncbi:hypothetical protein ELH39_07990 [Rhizobium ruizarguesonis]|uniref:hypothetical protein n=1 Tax=Rhizobium ruizarguesonis TaxID=2081791 RepID=UPI00103092B3|nr:hypothetical protein [Rhizobium ruizarguesonis]TBB97187.1 hypothetical protein ELH39_07990 [Rhizobium ruizarguesonis]
MNRALKIFISVWIAIAVIVNVVAIAGMFMHDGFWGGLARVQDTFSPFNIFNWIMEVILFAPAILASMWLERRKSRALETYLKQAQ